MEHLQKRGYKHSQIHREITKAKLVPRDQALQLSRFKQKLHQGIPFVVTYNPASPSLKKIITKHLSILQSSNCCKDVSKDEPLQHFQVMESSSKGLRIDAHELLPPRGIVLKLRKAFIAYAIIIQFTNLNVMVNCDKSLS